MLELRGVIPAMVTPFKQDGSLDEDALRQETRFLIENGVNGLLVIGSTGEFTLLTDDERKKAVETVIDETNGKVPVISGVLLPATNKAITFAKWAKDAGSDAGLFLTPFKVQPTREGLFEHYMMIADAIDLPMVLYNIPRKTGVKIDPEMIIRLSQHDNIIGIKQCVFDIFETMEALMGVGEKFNFLSGDDTYFLIDLILGSKGGVLATSCVVPQLWVELYEEFKKGNIKKALEINYKLMPLDKVLYCEPNPGPIKEALKILGRPAGSPRRPFQPTIRDENKKRMNEVLKNLNLL